MEAVRHRRDRIFHEQSLNQSLVEGKQTVAHDAGHPPNAGDSDRVGAAAGQRHKAWPSEVPAIGTGGAQGLHTFGFGLSAL